MDPAPRPLSVAAVRLLPNGQHLRVLEPGSPGRRQAEDFVGGIYAARFGARLPHFMPTLLTLADASGKPAGVIGTRQATGTDLYLEQYLDQPVECLLTRLAGQPVKRTAITELGNFAAADCRTARRLMALLPACLLRQGQLWVVFTATGLIREILASIGSTLHDLGSARAGRLGAGAAQWGAYFEEDPRVMAAWLPGALGVSDRRRRSH